MMKVFIDPEFEHLRQYIESLPGNFDRVGKLLEARRNVIREDVVKGTRLVIKSFKRIYLANKIRYSFFTRSKAQRAFDNARMLLKNGFETPKPIAYIELSSFGLIGESFFISEYIGYDSLRVVAEKMTGTTKDLMVALAGFTFSLHQKGIYHIDFSLGNILVNRHDGKTEFALIDNNRMQFGPVPLRKGIRNMVKLGLSTEQLTWLVEEYARLRQVDTATSVATFFQYKKNELKKRQMKRSFKEFVGVAKPAQ